MISCTVYMFFVMQLFGLFLKKKIVNWLFFKKTAFKILRPQFRILNQWKSRLAAQPPIAHHEILLIFQLPSLRTNGSAEPIGCAAAEDQWRHGWRRPKRLKLPVLTEKSVRWSGEGRWTFQPGGSMPGTVNMLITRRFSSLSSHKIKNLKVWNLILL